MSNGRRVSEPTFVDSTDQRQAMDYLPASGHALTVVVSTSFDDVELASDALWQLGAAAVEEIDEGGGVIGLRAALGENRIRLTEVLESLAWPWRFDVVDLTVADTWREHVGVIEVDERVRVVPAWIDVPEPSQETMTLRIEPGPTFGMGTHATTRLCLRALEREIVPGDSVLDVGTGSGVLAIAAVLFGAASALGTDLNPACLEVVIDNAVRNGVGEAVTVSLGHPSTLTGPFDVVVANILAPVLRELGPELVRLSGRRLILSGLLMDRYTEVLEAMQPMRPIEVLEEDGWAAVILAR